MSIERRWNRNKVSRESPDKEVNRRPTSLKKFRADALRGPRVSIATSWNIKSGGREEFLVSFLSEAVSAALLAEWDVECRYESAKVLTTVTSHVIIIIIITKVNAELDRDTNLVGFDGLLDGGDFCRLLLDDDHHLIDLPASVDQLRLQVAQVLLHHRHLRRGGTELLQPDQVTTARL